MDHNSWIMNSHSSPLVKFIYCDFCVCPWIILALELFYIIEYHPWWLFAGIGVFAGLGSGNLIVELVHGLRNDE
jgi:hypothetical protein